MNGFMKNTDRKTIHVPVTACLHKRGYELFAEEVEALSKQHGKIRILFDMADFQGGGDGVHWFGVGRIFPDVERVAFVGNRKWDKNIYALCKPFPRAQLRYFDHAHIDYAKAWVNDNDPLDGP